MMAFSLHWPLGYKRNTTTIKSRFQITMDKAQKFLHQQIKIMGATDLVVSTNIPVRNDGMLYANWMNKKIDDSGVAIYFKYKGKDVSMCCDQYEKVWENVYALAKGLEALRGMERWGVSEFLERAFTGFAGLPENSSFDQNYSCWKILGFDKKPENVSDIYSAYKQLAKKMHPDSGGNTEDFIKLNNAYNLALSQY